VTGDSFFSLPGVDHTVRSGRISWRCRVLWLDGAGCNEAYHGAKMPVYLGSAPLMSSQGIDPLLFFGGATLGCMGVYLCPSSSYPAHRLSHTQVQDTSLALYLVLPFGV
jgi:hypothetical protein